MVRSRTKNHNKRGAAGTHRGRQRGRHMNQWSRSACSACKLIRVQPRSAVRDNARSVPVARGRKTTTPVLIHAHRSLLWRKAQASSVRASTSATDGFCRTRPLRPPLRTALAATSTPCPVQSALDSGSTPRLRGRSARSPAHPTLPPPRPRPGAPRPLADVLFVRKAIQ